MPFNGPLKQVQIHDGPNQSLADMFGFDMLVHGLHSDYPAEHD